jgi:hypothetical protein
MPRKSAASSVIPLATRDNRVRPPANLAGPERDLLVSLVANNAPSHFKESDLPLLCQYVAAAVLSERAMAELRKAPVVDGKTSPWLLVFEKASRAMVALSMRLRLSPQARAPNTPTRREAPASAYEIARLSE